MKPQPIPPYSPTSSAHLKAPATEKAGRPRLPELSREFFMANYEAITRAMLGGCDECRTFGTAGLAVGQGCHGCGKKRTA